MDAMNESLNAEQIAVRLLALMPRFVDWGTASLRAKRGDGDPSFRQLVVLFQIQRGATSPVALANRLGISRAVVTGLLDRLEQRGLIQREADPLCDAVYFPIAAKSNPWRETGRGR